MSVLILRCLEVITTKLFGSVSMKWFPERSRSVEDEGVWAEPKPLGDGAQNGRPKHYRVD